MDYWFLTLAEISQVITAQRAKIKTKAAMDYRLADLMAASLGRLVDDEVKFPSIHEAYPGLFEAPVPQYEDSKMLKERLLQFAIQHGATLNEE